MITPLKICLGFASFIILAVFGWRFASRLPCPVWLRWLVELDNPFTEANRSDVIIQHLNLQRGMTVLDIGCGPGRLTIPVAEQVGPRGAVVAIDLQAGMLAAPRNELKRQTWVTFGLFRLEWARVNWKPVSPTAPLLVTVLGEIPDREAALREVFAALKPGGMLSVTETIFDPHFQRRDTVLRLADAVGFREKAFFGNRMAFTLNLERPYGG
jgi:SAM-dependent methyltransferase